MSDVTITNAPDRNRYEAHLDGESAGFAEYRLAEGVIEFHHTEVDDAFGGKGVGSAIARGALDDVRSGSMSGRRVVASCSFIRGWIDKHPDYADLLYGARP